MRTKEDRKRISRQLHEIAYCRRLAKQVLRKDLAIINQNSVMERLAKALLKFTKGYTKSPNGRKWTK
jgi:hypothetical protein